MTENEKSYDVVEGILPSDLRIEILVSAFYYDWKIIALMKITCFNKGISKYQY